MNFHSKATYVSDVLIISDTLQIIGNLNIINRINMCLIKLFKFEICITFKNPFMGVKSVEIVSSSERFPSSANC